MEIGHANTLMDLLEQEYKVRATFVEDPEVVEVQNTVTLLLRNNPNRVAFLMINISANNIYVSPRNTVAAAAGILLAANGGSFVTDWKRDFILPALNWYGIAGAANSDFYCIEVLLY